LKQSVSTFISEKLNQEGFNKFLALGQLFKHICQCSVCILIRP